jgi:hypothetical protein
MRAVLAFSSGVRLRLSRSPRLSELQIFLRLGRHAQHPANERVASLSVVVSFAPAHRIPAVAAQPTAEKLDQSEALRQIALGSVRPPDR